MLNGSNAEHKLELNAAVKRKVFASKNDFKKHLRIEENLLNSGSMVIKSTNDLKKDLIYRKLSRSD